MRRESAGGPLTSREVADDWERGRAALVAAAAAGAEAAAPSGPEAAEEEFLASAAGGADSALALAALAFGFLTAVVDSGESLDREESGESRCFLAAAAFLGSGGFARDAGVGTMTAEAGADADEEEVEEVFLEALVREASVVAAAADYRFTASV